MNANPQPVMDPAFWRKRLEEGGPRSAVFHCTDAEWERHEKRHRAILDRVIGPSESVLDLGCGYGRLIDLMPPRWQGPYLGVDLSPDLIKVASEKYPDRAFCVANIAKPEFWRSCAGDFDWVIAVSLKYTIIGNCGLETWNFIYRHIVNLSWNTLFLEFDLTEEPDYGVERI